FTIAVSIHQLRVSRQKSTAQVTRKFKQLFVCQTSFLGCQLIVEYTTYSARFLPMFNKKVVIGPSFKFGIKISMMLIANILHHVIKKSLIVFYHIMGSKIDSYTEPADIFTQFKVTYIHMDDRHPRIIGMDHDRYTGCKKIFFFHLKRFFNRRWQFTMNSGEIDAAFF